MLYIANPKAKTARMSKVRTKPQDSPKTNAPKEMQRLMQLWKGQ